MIFHILLMASSKFEWIQGMWSKVSSSKYLRSWHLAICFWALHFMITYGDLILIFYIEALNITRHGPMGKTNYNLSEILLLLVGIWLKLYGIDNQEHFLIHSTMLAPKSYQFMCTGVTCWYNMDHTNILTIFETHIWFTWANVELLFYNMW